MATVVVLVLAALFTRLGFWQLDRLEERRVINISGEERLSAAPVELRSLLDQSGDDLDSVEYRRVTMRGEYDTTKEVLIRSQVELGQAGFHVITPLRLDDGSAVLVNRGWVPLSMDSPPIAATPDEGVADVAGWIRLSQSRPTLGPEDPPGDLAVFNRVDVERIGDQVPYELAPVYVVAMGEGSDELPVTVDPPDFTEQGPHLAYAIQWFGFAVVGLVGLYFLLRRQVRQST